MAVFFCAVPGWAEKLVIYHTSDIHGYYFPRLDKNNRLFGGFSIFENVLRSEKEPFVLLDSGDFSSGNKEANDSNGLYSIELMNAAGKSSRNVLGRGYAALTVGNHDSDFGAELLGKMLSGFQGDILSVNLRGLAVKNKSLFPFRVYNWNGRKVAVIGYSLNGPGMGENLSVRALNSAEWKILLDEVYAERPDAVVLLAHDSIADARKASQILESLAPVLNEKRKVDVFLGGHAHILNTERRLGECGPLFVESGAMLEGTTRVELDFNDQTGVLENVSARYIRLDSKTWGENAETAERLAKIENTSLRKIYASIPKRLSKYPQGEDASADVAKLLADSMKKWLDTREKVDFAMFQLPGVRRDLEKGLLSGRDLAELLPYTEYVSTFSIPGKKFKQAAQASLKCGEKGRNYSLFSYSSNVYIEYRCRPGNHKRPVKITGIYIDGKKLSGRKIYRVGAIAHIPDGYFEGAPFKGYKYPQKKVYRKTSGELLFDLIDQLPSVNGGNKELVAPGDVRIAEKK